MSAWKETVDAGKRVALQRTSFYELRSIGLTLGIVLFLVSPGAAAESPVVTFDVGHWIACRTVPSAETALTDPGEKIVEAKFRVSTLVTAGEAKDVDELLIVIASREGRLRVVDFSPETEMVTDVEGSIETIETEDVARSFDARLGGIASAGQGIVDLQLKPSLGGGVTKGNSLKETLRRRAPKTLKVASGTVDGETGVFFKLKRDTQSTLEGVKDYSCRFAVPLDWRADQAIVSCFARTQRKECFVKRTHLCGSAEFSVGLYLEGDVEGKQLARELAEGFTSSLGEQSSTSSDNRLLRFFEESFELIVLLWKGDRLCCD